MAPALIIAGAIKAFFEFLCTPEGQEFCKTNRENLAKFNAVMEKLSTKMLD